MPIYVYECSSCGERFEYSQSIKDPPKTVCEKCSGKLEKVIVPIAFHLKGGGWYKDLYSSQKASGGSSSTAPGTSPASESKTESSSSSASSSASAGTNTESKTESKSEAKTESKSESAKPSSDK